MTDMGCKLDVFKDPFLDRATETDDLMNKIRDLGGNPGTNGDVSGLSPGSKDSAGSFGAHGSKDYLNDLLRQNEDLKAKADRVNDLQKRRDDLDGRKMKRQGIEELRTGLQSACNDYDRMADDLEQQVADMDEITQRVNQAIDDRGAALEDQIGQDGELSTLKMKKQD